MADSVADRTQAAWDDTKDATKHVAAKTKQKANETLKGAQQSANFLGNKINTKKTMECDYVTKKGLNIN